MASLQAVIAEIATVLRADLTIPSGQRLAKVETEPSLLSQFPCAVILEAEVTGEPDEIETSVGGTEDYVVYVIGVHLLTGQAFQGQAINARRPWVKPLIEVFNTKPTLNGVVDTVRVMRVSFEPFEWGAVEAAYTQVHVQLAVSTVS